MAEDFKKIEKGKPIIVYSQSLKEVFDKKLDNKIGKQVKELFLSKFFNDDDWKSMEVRGNGLCLFYAYEAADNKMYECSVDDDVLKRFSKMVVDGIENYFTARDQHEKIIPRIDLPNILSTGKIDLDFIENDEKNTIKYNKSDFSLENFSSEKKTLTERITTILGLEKFNNSPRELSVVLAYANNRNILQISYKTDTTGNPQLFFDFFPCYNIIESKSQISNDTTILFLKTGHFFPIFHSNKTIKNKTIKLIKTITDKYQGDKLFNYDVTTEKFKTSDITLNDDIEEAEAAIALEPPEPKLAEPEPAPAPAPAPEKTPVQILLKKKIVNYFKERKERNRIKDEKGGE
jgi:hypothetical protein